MNGLDSYDFTKFWHNLKLALIALPAIFVLHCLLIYLAFPAFFATAFEDPLKSVFFITVCIWTGSLICGMLRNLTYWSERALLFKINPEFANRRELRKLKQAHNMVLELLNGGKASLVPVLKNRFRGMPMSFCGVLPVIWVVSIAAPNLFVISSPLNIVAFSAFFVVCRTLISACFDLLFEHDYRTRSGADATKCSGLVKMLNEVQEERKIELKRLQLSIDHDPSAETYLARAKFKLDNKSGVEAILDFDRALEYAPDNAAALEGRAEAYQLLDLKYLAHMDLLKAASLAQAGSDQHRRLIEKLKDAKTSSSPTSTIKSTGEAMAMTGMMFSGDSAKLEDYKLKEVQRDLDANKQSASVYHRQAELLFAKADYTNALVAANQAIEFKSDNSTFYSTRAKIQVQLLNLEEGLRDYDKAIELDDKNANALEERARIMLVCGEFEQVVKDCTYAMTFAKSYQFKYLRASALLNLKRYDEAIADFSDFIEKWEVFVKLWDALLLPIFKSIANDLRTQLRDAYEQRSSAYEQIGDLDKAAHDAIRAAKLKETRRWTLFKRRET